MTQAEFEKIIKQLTELREKKNHDYGDGFLECYDKYGQIALFFDMLRKWRRIENLLYRGKTNKVEDETIEDTLGDLAIMAINGLVWLKKKNERN